MDKNEEALALFERVLKIEEKAYGPEHTSVASTLHEIARLRSKMDQNEEALALFERVLKIFEKAYGPQHNQWHLRCTRLRKCSPRWTRTRHLHCSSVC